MGIDQIDIDAYEDGTDIAHDAMYLEAYVTKPGYVYIYLSNENPKQVEVYFDDLTITHNHTPVIQTDDYYPFGLTFNSSERSGFTSNKFLYNGIELHEDLGWDNYLADFRSYDPAIGRWGQIDPKTSERESPYVGMANNPIMYADPLGDTIRIEGLFNADLAGTDGYNNHGLNLSLWNEISSSIYTVTGIKLTTPTKDGEALKIESLDTEVGSSTAREWYSMGIKSSETDHSISINPDGYNGIASFFPPDGQWRVHNKTGTVKINTKNFSLMEHIAIESDYNKETLGYGLTIMHELTHQYGNMNHSNGRTIAEVNRARSELGYPSRLNDAPVGEGMDLIFGRQKTGRVSGIVSLKKALGR